jgi:ABC-type molybdate transport system substrate-binding protein
MLPVIFKRAGIDFRKLNKDKQINTHRSGSHVANLIKMDAGDAGMVWQAVAHLRQDGLDSIRIDEYLPVPNVDTITSATRKVYSLTPVKVTVSTLMMSKKKEEAENFIRFILSNEGGQILRNYGFAVPDNVRKQFYSNGLRVEPNEIIEKGD